MSEYQWDHFKWLEQTARRNGKGEMLATWRDALLKAGKPVTIASLVAGQPHLCSVVPFKRATTPREGKDMQEDEPHTPASSR